MIIKLPALWAYQEGSLRLINMDKNISTNIQLKGLSCSACQKIVEKRLKNITGVEGVTVDLETGKVQITADKSINNNEISDALNDTDFKLVK